MIKINIRRARVDLSEFATGFWASDSSVQAELFSRLSYELNVIATDHRALQAEFKRGRLDAIRNQLDQDSLSFLRELLGD